MRDTQGRITHTHTASVSTISYQTGYVNKAPPMVKDSKCSKQLPLSLTFFGLVFCVDLQVECEDQGDLGMAGARLLSLRAPVCSDP